MLPSRLVQTVGLQPGATAGEGVARRLGSRVPLAATRGHPYLGVATSSEGKVGEGSDPGSVGVVQLHRSADTLMGLTSRYKDH